MNVAALQRKLARLQDQAARSLLAKQPLEITCYWGNEDIPHIPGATVIETEWGSPALAREDRGNQDQGE